MADEFKRRDLFRMTAGGLLIAGTGLAQTPAFFTKDEYAALDELMDTIIPTDEHSPGAKAAACAAYTDRRLAESLDAKEKETWRDGVKMLEAQCRKKFDTGIVAATAQQRIELLDSIASNEKHPVTPEEKFFSTLKNATAFAYYSSSIGIHQDMNYKGNVPIVQFVGMALK